MERGIAINKFLLKQFLAACHTCVGLQLLHWHICLRLPFPHVIVFHCWAGGVLWSKGDTQGTKNVDKCVDFIKWYGSFFFLPASSWQSTGWLPAYTIDPVTQQAQVTHWFVLLAKSANGYRLNSQKKVMRWYLMCFITVFHTHTSG